MGLSLGRATVFHLLGDLNQCFQLSVIQSEKPMLPLQQAYEVKGSSLESIRTTYRFKEPDVMKELYEEVLKDLN